MCILTDAAFARTNSPESLAQTLLSSMPCGRPRRSAIGNAISRLFPWLPPVGIHSNAVRLRSVAGASRARRAEAVVILFGHGEEIWLEGGELERRIGARVPRRCGRHGGYS